jgi:hypothetical protein
MGLLSQLKVRMMWAGCWTWLIFLLWIPISSLQAQEATFFENFDDTELYEIPEGWTIYQKGGTDPTAHWQVSTYGMWGPKVAYSSYEGAKEGEIDEDWLITPQITPAAGDFLIFDAAQQFVWFDYGTKYHVLISTKTNKPADFTDTLQSWTESEFPEYLYDTKIQLDLAAYVGKPIYIAFVHENSSSMVEETDDWYLDNVWVRPPQEAHLFEAYLDSQILEEIPIDKDGVHVILSANLNVVGDGGTVNVTSFTFTKNGTSFPEHVIGAKLYYTGAITFISFAEDQTTDSPTFGTVTNPGDTFTITGNMDLPVGNNYFWMVYDLDPSIEAELTYPYPEVDGTIEQVMVDGKVYPTTISTKRGGFSIVPSVPENDNFADAISLSPTQTRYGSFNNTATSEPDIEQLAYCAPDGYYDVANSIWWHFKAPADGWISGDLSESNFNTILLFLDTAREQLACNDDVDASKGMYQSKITDFPVQKGQEIYVRVTGVGDPNSPNGESGIVSLDFTFTPALVTGTEDELTENSISVPYPNPGSDIVSFDLKPKTSGKVAIQICDVLGHPLYSFVEGPFPTGNVQTIRFDASHIPEGNYILQVGHDGTVDGRQRFIIAR